LLGCVSLLLMLWTAPPRGYDTGGYAGIQRDI
jgi:hypothetical protein